MSSVMRLKEILERSHEQLGARKLAQLANSPQLTGFSIPPGIYMGCSLSIEGKYLVKGVVNGY